MDSDAGLLIVNKNGFIQIDSNFRNTALVKSSKMYGAGEHVATFSGATQPMVFVTCAQGVWGGKASLNGNVFSYNYRAYGDSTYYIFDMIGATGNFGLQVFNKDKECVFDSNHYYLKAVTNVYLTAGTNNINKFIRLDANKVYASACTGLARFSVTLDDPKDPRKWIQTIGTAKIGATNGGYNLIYTTSYRDGYLSDEPDDVDFSSLVLIADVTDLPDNY